MAPACGYFQVFDRIETLPRDVAYCPDMFERIFDCSRRYRSNGLFSIEKCRHLSPKFGGVEQRNLG
jgi:hypothetical protein